MIVRAKFHVTHKTSYILNVDDGTGKYVPKEVGSVKLQPVYGKSDENKTWAKCTPCGSIEMTVDNPDAYAAFTLGEEYFIDFTPAKG